jgi:DNA-binding HxlR family transcriptional regulator
VSRGTVSQPIWAQSPIMCRHEVSAERRAYVMTRIYSQKCLAARALDVLGERWTLLIVRELGLGPRRFSELLDGLPGIGTNLLSARLKHLEQHDILTRVALGGPGQSFAYQLTDRGEAITPILGSLVQWAAGLPAAPRDYEHRTRWTLFAMRATAGDRGEAFDTVTELIIGEDAFWMCGDGSNVQLRPGRAPVRPGLRLTCSKATLVAVATQRTTVAAAAASGALVVDGDIDTATEFFAVFTITDAPPAGETPLKRRRRPARQ